LGQLSSYWIKRFGRTNYKFHEQCLTFWKCSSDSKYNFLG